MPIIINSPDDPIMRKCGLTRADICPPSDTPDNALVNPANTNRTGFGTDTSGAAWKDQAIPVPFGWVRVNGAEVFINPAMHGMPGSKKQCVLVAFGKGPVQNLETEDLFIGTKRSSAYSLVTLVSKHLGTYAQALDSHWSITTTGYFQRHPGLCYAIFDFDEGWTAALPNFAGYVSGYNNIYDPRLNTGSGGYGWTDNLPLVLACCMTDRNLSNGIITSADMEWSSITDAANYYDQYVSNGTSLNITGINTSGGRCTVTCNASHGQHIGDCVYTSGITGTIGTNLNGKYWRVRYPSSGGGTKLDLANVDMELPSTAGWGTWTSGGTMAPVRKLGPINLSWNRQASLQQWIETIRAHANMQIVRVGGLYRMYPDKAPSGPIFAFNANTPGLSVQNQQYSSVGYKDKPSAVQITFYGKYETTYGGYPRGDDTLTVTYPGNADIQDETRIWKYQVEGLSSYAQAYALAKLLYLWGTLGFVQGSFNCSSEGLELIQWSVISIQQYMDYAGDTPKNIRLVSVNPQSDRTYKISWRNYDARIYA